MISIRTSTTKQRFSRRALLKSMGISAAFLPLINAERARAATPAGVVKRLITITWPNGMPVTAFWPASETQPTGSPVLKPLEPFAAKVLLAAGLDLKVMHDAGRKQDGHFSYASLWSGTYKSLNRAAAGGGQFSTAAGPTLDQVYADFVAKQTNLPVPVMSLSLVNADPYTGFTSHRNDGTGNTAETDPARLFTRLFSGGALAPEAALNLQARRKSILDFVSGDLQSFASRLGTDDKGKINAHLDSVRDLERQLTATQATAMSCQQGTAPAAGGDFPTRMKGFLDLTALAIRCDLTRSVSMVWGADGGSAPSSFGFLGVGDYHAIAHQGAGGYTQKIKIDTWFYTQVAYLVQILDSTAELGGSALDHSVVAVSTDMNEGNGHYTGRIPFTLIGSAGGYLKTGRMVKLGTWAGKTGQYWNSDSGVPNNKLLATLGNALGMPGDSFGVNYPGTLPELVA